jgi:hypothetical protein
LKGTKIAKKMGGMKLSTRNEEEKPGITGNKRLNRQIKNIHQINTT